MLSTIQNWIWGPKEPEIATKDLLPWITLLLNGKIPTFSKNEKNPLLVHAGDKKTTVAAVATFVETAFSLLLLLPESGTCEKLPTKRSISHSGHQDTRADILYGRIQSLGGPREIATVRENLRSLLHALGPLAKAVPPKRSLIGRVWDLLVGNDPPWQIRVKRFMAMDNSQQHKHPSG